MKSSTCLRERFEIGNRALQEGKCAVIVLAAGSGSRLRYHLPKGCFPITPIKKKSLFQLLCEKVKAASKYYGRPLEVAFMTSKENSSSVQKFFHERDHFGLAPSQLHFFTQRDLPLLDLNERELHVVAPCGNGDLFEAFCLSPIFSRWHLAGIENVSVISIDNPLANPFDCDAIGLNLDLQRDVTLIGIEKRGPCEKVGSIVQNGEQIRVVEYTEGGIQSLLGNAGIYHFHLNFLEKAAKFKLPLHLAKKEHGGFPVYKREKFIFDILISTTKAAVLTLPRKSTFAPLKNFEGEDSISTVALALKEYDFKVLESFGIFPKRGHHFELSTDFYFPTPQLKQKWQGRNIDNLSYIEGL